MKKLITLLIVVSITFSGVYSQCKYKIKATPDTDSSGSFLYINKLCAYGGSKESFQFHISKKNDNYYFLGTVSRMYSRKFAIPAKYPLVFAFEDSSKIVLFPAFIDTTAQYGINGFDPAFWSKTGSVIYEINVDQLRYLSDHIPIDVRLHYLSDQINPDHTDEYGAYWPFNFRLKFYHKKFFLKAVPCAFTM